MKHEHFLESFCMFLFIEMIPPANVSAAANLHLLNIIVFQENKKVNACIHAITRQVKQIQTQSFISPMVTPMVTANI